MGLSMKLVIVPIVSSTSYLEPTSEGLTGQPYANMYIELNVQCQSNFETDRQLLTDKYIIYMRSTALKSVLFIFSLSILITCLLLPVQLYGSTILCDQSLNLTNCDERSSSSSTSDTTIIDNSRSDNTETPLIIPDISPTDKDLEDATTDGDRGTTDTDVNNDNDNDNDDSENSIDENSDDDRDSSDSEGGSSDNEPSLIPFP
jgi:hypothetical protein